MREIGVVGGGFGGLVLANGLVSQGFGVTLITDRSAEDIQRGYVLSTQCLWGPAIAIEKKMGLDYGNGAYRGIGGFHVRFGDTARSKHQEFSARLSQPGQSVDYRVQLPALMNRFIQHGGRIKIRVMEIDDLESLAESHDLVIVSTGRARGSMRELFPRDISRNSADGPQRVGGVIYVKDRISPPVSSGDCPFEEWTLIPEVGEFFVIPAYSVSGNCHIICLEGYLGGPLDRFKDVESPEQCFATMKRLIEEWLPWERERCEKMQLIDDRAAISGGFTPAVRHPIGRLPSGCHILAFGDLFVLNDPLIAQGGNTAVKLAELLIDKLVERGAGPLDEAWMRGYADKAWEEARCTVEASNMFLSPDASFWRWFGRASADQTTADEIIRGFEQPAHWVELLKGADCRIAPVGELRAPYSVTDRGF